MKYKNITFTLLLLLISHTALAQEEQLTTAEGEYAAWASQLWESLNQQRGEIQLPNGVAKLQVPDGFYYLDPSDSEKVLVEAWENPPGAGSETLGMLFPSSATPFDPDAWAVTIEYEEDGYVSDDDADEIDYEELLSQMKDDTELASEARVEQGYQPIALMGWASKPYYDKATHKLYWAKEIKFADEKAHTLNYSIRMLGRKGVLVLNFIAGMDQKDLIDGELNSVLALAEFNPGYRYEDFDVSIDKVAAYGLGALVAGKVLVKTGFLALALVFLKKFGVFIVIALGAFLVKFFRRGGNKK